MRDSVAYINGNVTNAYIEQDAGNNFAMQLNVFGQSKNYVFSVHPTQGIYLWNRDTQSDEWIISPLKSNKWNEGYQIENVDKNGNGWITVFDIRGIAFYEVTNGIATKRW